jgi:hypothetical protein
MEELGLLNLRMVKMSLQEEREELLITNLSTEIFDRFQIENFTRTKSLLLLQDIYSMTYISNLAGDILRNTEAKLDKKEKHRKHKMMINRTLSIGILKNNLIYILLERDAKNRISYSIRFMNTLAKI